jgi:hypothetical protein
MSTKMFMAYIEKAHEYQTDDLEIDDAPEVVRGEGGMWVPARIFISDEEAKHASDDKQPES